MREGPASCDFREGSEISEEVLRFQGRLGGFREGPEISGEPSEISERALRFQGGF